MGKRLAPPLLAQSRVLGTSSRTEQLASSCSTLPQTRVHIRADQDDPTKAWSALKKVFVQQKASSRFVAYDVKQLESTQLESTVRNWY